ncbi:MAG: hypothetical protein LJE70_00605 [Chromatiaceae bacterium]|nr:hypothetical protein [Chromatiaceae bacterium]
MKPDLEFAYAQTRIQARLAAVPAEAEWERLAASRTLSSFLEEARGGSMRDWVRGFSGQSDFHDLEGGLRSLFRENLDMVVRWVPVAWREALSWIRWLTLLPLLAHLQSGRAAPGWVSRDTLLRDWVDADGGLDERHLEDAGAQCLLYSQDDLQKTWIAEWRRRWPRRGREVCQGLDDLTTLLMTHLQTFRQASPASAWRLRRELRERLRLRFRQQTLQPMVPFIYLALVALDLERLRSALISRALFSMLEEPERIEIAGQVAV